MNFGRAYYDETKVHPTSYKANNAAIWAVSHDGSTYAGEALYSYRGKAGFTTRDFKARFPAIWLADNDKPIRLATIRQGGSVPLAIEQVTIQPYQAKSMRSVQMDRLR